MFPIESFRNTLQKFVDILRQPEVPFHLTGVVTAAAYGEPRLTQDIDIVVQNKAVRERLDELLNALSNCDFVFTR